jgi:NAD(P)-binding Rossmann-like domain
MSMRTTGRAQNLEDAVRKQILNAAQPSKDENVYFVGPFARRVNFMSQQARALNLVWALAEDGVLKDYPRVAIVGAGLTGLTAAAALIAKECPLSIFEMNDSEVARAASFEASFHPPNNKLLARNRIESDNKPSFLRLDCWLLLRCYEFDPEGVALTLL